jgi:hypothetical protein
VRVEGALAARSRSGFWRWVRSVARPFLASGLAAVRGREERERARDGEKGWGPREIEEGGIKQDGGGG